MGVRKKIVESQAQSILRGDIIRVSGKYPYEHNVDFMMFETNSEDSPYGLIVTSGYKAGLILVYLPKESNSDEGGLSKAWLVSNWKKWVYPDCDISDGYLIGGYEAA
ncbi:hypothetical protein H7698_02510 [Pseudomonas sp. p50]|nr:hypothetical protein [Pseudomonas sp. p50(2008)]